jgi:hypothetical protein
VKPGGATITGVARVRSLRASQLMRMSAEHASVRCPVALRLVWRSSGFRLSSAAAATSWRAPSARGENRRVSRRARVRRGPSAVAGRKLAGLGDAATVASDDGRMKNTHRIAHGALYPAAMLPRHTTHTPRPKQSQDLRVPYAIVRVGALL